MSTDLSAAQIEQDIVDAGLEPLAEGIAERFQIYLELLQRWNSKLNLTAIRDSSGILERHFVESIFCAQQLPFASSTLLDYGSGAGFPGIPVALCRPEIAVTLAESQGKKTAFLCEAVRTLNLNVEVYSGRVEAMVPGRTFDVVTLRAVDRMADAVAEAMKRGRLLAVLTTGGARPNFGPAFEMETRRMPGLRESVLLLARRR